MTLSLPSSFGSQALFSTYYLAQPDDYDPVKPNMTAFEEAEMTAALALVPRDETTKLFVVDFGNWNTAGNWYPSGVPGAGSIVCIPEGCICTYNVSAPLTELFTVRVDGTLKTDITVDTAMLFDTMVVTPLGTFQEGTRAHPVPQGITHQWIIATSNGLIDVTWDTFFQSRGIVNLGYGDVWGAYKTPYLEVATYAGPVASATSLTLESTPTNWQVGDEIIIGSTARTGGFWNGFAIAWNPMRDEKRTLTSVSSATLGWTGGLTYSHAGPTGTLFGETCKAYVINLTRNVVFKTDTTSAPIHHRGHMMQMHNPLGWSMRDAEVADLGRTAKLSDWHGRIVFSNAGCLANVALPISDSPYWDAGAAAIILGPTFLVHYSFTASGNGSFTITGTDEDGAPQTETINYSTGANNGGISTKYFLTITEIEFTTAFASTLPRIYIEARARQMNENGVRNMNSSLTPGDWTYTAIKNTVNIQGRYPFHWHKLGISGSILLAPPVVDNCSFHGSHGWLFAHHQSHGNVTNSSFYDAQGAGLVGEDGNETGNWFGNIGCHFRGNSDVNFKGGESAGGGDTGNKDPARQGAAFWFTGRNIRAANNIAISCEGGFVYQERVANVTLVSALMDQPTAFRGSATADIADTPIGHFVDNKAIATGMGIKVVKANEFQNHDLRTPIVRFHAWSIEIGMSFEYTSRYTMIDFKAFGGYIVADDGSTLNTRGNQGSNFHSNAFDQVFVNPSVEGFLEGLNLAHGNTNPALETDPEDGRIVINPTFIDCTDNYVGRNSDIDPILATGDLNSDPVTLTNAAVTFRSGTIYDVTATKHDEIGNMDFQTTIEQFTYGENPGQLLTDLLTLHGYWTQGAAKYLMVPEWFSSRVTGLMDVIITPIDVSSFTLTSYTNNGAIDLNNNMPPALADFTVSMTLNTNLDIDILSRSVGNVVSFAGFQRPMKTYLIDNGDGTITAVPLADENYAETCHVWVDDVNGNTTRAVMTINVEKYKFTLGDPE